VLDIVIALHQANDYDAKEGASFEIHFEKARGFYGEEAEPFKARIHTYENEGIKWEIGAITTNTFDSVIEMTRQGHAQQDIAKTLNIHKSNVSRHVARAKQEGKLRSCVT
jgi:DNA invertase Pin-like site-specific DNA recombinase